MVNYTLNFIKKETLAQVLSCEFCQISKNTFSYRTTPVPASSNSIKRLEFIDNSDKSMNNNL